MSEFVLGKLQLQSKQSTFVYVHVFQGKFGQRNNQNQMSYFKDPAKFLEHVMDESNQINSVLEINPNIVAVTWAKEEKYTEMAGNTNPVIAAFTTCQARLKLYEYFERLEERALYWDTGVYRLLLTFIPAIEYICTHIVPTFTPRQLATLHTYVSVCLFQIL